MWLAADDIDAVRVGVELRPLLPDLRRPRPGPTSRPGRCSPRWRRPPGGSGVGCQVTGMIYRHPAVLANMAATVDIISGGRLELGLGAGWNQMECDAYGIDAAAAEGALRPVRRGRRGDRPPADRGDHRRSTGSYVQLTDARCEPKPVQQTAPADHHRRQRPDSARCARSARWAQQWNAIAAEPAGLAGAQGGARRALRRHRPGLGRDHLLGERAHGAGRRARARSRDRSRLTTTRASTWSS